MRLKRERVGRLERKKVPRLGAFMGSRLGGKNPTSPSESPAFELVTENGEPIITDAGDYIIVGTA